MPTFEWRVLGVRAVVTYFQTLMGILLMLWTDEVGFIGDPAELRRWLMAALFAAAGPVVSILYNALTQYGAQLEGATGDAGV